MATSIYSSKGSRLELVADAMISVGNLYPENNVRLLPIIDTLSLLVQKPLCFSFFRKDTGNKYKLLQTTMCDPDLEIEFEPVVRNIEKTGEKLIPIPETDFFLGVRAIEPYRICIDNKLTLKANFPALDTKTNDAFEKLFWVLQKEDSGLEKKCWNTSTNR